MYFTLHALFLRGHLRLLIQLQTILIVLLLPLQLRLEQVSFLFLLNHFRHLSFRWVSYDLLIVAPPRLHQLMDHIEVHGQSEGASLALALGVGRNPPTCLFNNLLADGQAEANAVTINVRSSLQLAKPREQ